ncbi:UNVERIFIED_CONTAM: LINE-1 retrotransposable element O protein, partial [Sesamum latifolium]
MVPREDGSEIPCKVDVEYEWLPLKCTVCMTLGHSSKGCPTKKPRQPPVSVYVPKPVVGSQEPREELRDELAPVVPTTAAPAPVVGTVSMDREDMGKAIVLYNAFEMINAAIWNVRGLNRRDHQGRPSLWKRLDRLLVNDWWLECWPNTYYESLNARTSDHSPWSRGDNSGQAIGMFHFDNYLTLSVEFLPAVQRIWQHHIVGTTMFVVTRKLRALKPVFRAQRQKRGDLSNNVKLAGGFLEAAQHLLAQDRHSGVLTSQPAVTNEFLTYYQTLLGGSQRDRLIDLRYLRPWARHVLSEEEARSLLVPVTAEEIQAVFDIDETKAPGPDGYSSGFFKAAWPIVGREVTKAIMDFLYYRVWPISCCNVLYKAITKILVQRMRGILAMLVSPSQNAFVPGRSIGDNILLAQELLYGYNQQHLPPWCALKFIGWIVECITTPSFSVCLNGSPHGYFRGARGLRQGDPMSPYLFVLVMEVLSLILRQVIDQDGGFSIIGSVGRCSYEGHLPLRYLGLPLLSSRLSIADCQPILHKIVDCIRGWDGIMLSFAGRVQLIKSVLSALQVYWAMAFILPKHVIKEIEKRLRNFLWRGNADGCAAKVAWQQLTAPPSGWIGFSIIGFGNSQFGR